MKRQGHLLREDKLTIRDLKRKQISTDTLEEVFSHINDNKRFKTQEKEYLKKILTDNINKAYKRDKEFL